MEEHAAVPRLAAGERAPGRPAAAAAPPAGLGRALASRRLVGGRFLAGTGAVSMATFAAAALLFLLIPRIGFGLFFKNARSGVHMAGFSDGVELGGHGLIKDDDTVVMRVEVGQPWAGRDAPPLHWRGAAFDEYTRGEWRRSRRAPVTAKRLSIAGGSVTHTLLYDRARAGAPDRPLRQEIYLEPLGYDVLFGASMPAAFRVAAAYRDRPGDERNDEIRRAHSAGIKYSVVSEASPPAPDLLRRAPRVLPPGYGVYLQLPPEITPRVRALAAEIARGAATDYDRAVAIERYLSRSLSYTLEMESPRGREPIDFFLFERRKGHCEYFSSAMTVLLRAVGVPARNVNGFLGGEWNEYDEYVAVRAGDAHSWVEVYFAGSGWVTFDPTPAASADSLGRGDGLVDRLRRLADTVRFKWFKWVIEYDLERQLGLFQSIGDFFRGGADAPAGETWRDAKSWAGRRRGALLALAACAAAAAALALWRRRRRRGPDAPRRRRDRDPVSALYLAALRALGRRGWPRPAAATPREHARALARAGAPGASQLGELTELYYAAEYGGLSDDAAHRQARQLSDAIARALCEEGRGRRWPWRRRRRAAAAV
jgi:transglutaminase-like putative cysteine protease